MLGELTGCLGGHRVTGSSAHCVFFQYMNTDNVTADWPYERLLQKSFSDLLYLDRPVRALNLNQFS